MGFNELLTAVVTNGIGAVCAAAVLWFAWFRETRTLPGIMRTVEQLNVSFEQRNAKVVDAFVKVIAEERSVCQKWHEENRDRLDRLNVEARDHRHLIRNLAHQLGLRQAVEEERKRQGRPPAEDD